MLGVPCLHCTAMVQPPDRSSVRVRPGRMPRTGGGQPDTTSCDTPTGRGTRAVLYRQVPAASSIPHVPAQQLRPTASQHQLPLRARGSSPTMHGLQFARPELAHSHSDQSDQDPTFCAGGAAKGAQPPIQCHALSGVSGWNRIPCIWACSHHALGRATQQI
eukprot:COSAG05_NODE_2729_length_2721_cov_60.319985_1_plen_161_part_00